MKKYEYVPFNGDQVSVDLAITSSVQLLDLAALAAVDSKDVASILAVSDKWLDFGERLAEYPGLDEEEDPEEEELIPAKQDRKFGFAARDTSSKEIAGEVEDDGTENDD